MNSLTLLALTMVYCLMPGLFLYWGFLNGLQRGAKLSEADSSAVPIGSYSTTLFVSILASPALHFIWLRVFGGDFNADIVIYLLSGNFGDSEKNALHLTNIFDNGVRIYAYLISLSVLAYLLGAFLKWIIRRYKLDHRFVILKNRDNWHYILTGSMQEEESSFTIISVAIGENSKTYIYKGVLSEYELSRNGWLGIVFLKYPQRYLLGEPNEPHEIAGEYLAVDCSHAKTINLDYFYVKEKNERTNTIDPISDREAAQATDH